MFSTYNMHKNSPKCPKCPFCPFQNLLKCTLCDYSTPYSRDWNRHILSNKHEHNRKNGQKPINAHFAHNEIIYSEHVCGHHEHLSSNNSKINAKIPRPKQKNGQNEKTGHVSRQTQILTCPILNKQYYCEQCDYTTPYIRDWNRHILTPKHTKHTTQQPDSITTLIEQNKELTNKNMELTSKIINICQNLPPTTITNNSNKTFNLNVFLNNTCKNAMNMSDFVSMIQPKIENLEETGQLGYVTGISNLILNQLNEMDLDNRPVHCRDLKREVLYVKDKNEWNKETFENPILTNAIRIVAHKNIKTINEWREKHPDCNDIHSKYNNEYLRIVSNAMAGGSQGEINKNMNKIVHNIAKEVLIDK